MLQLNDQNGEITIDFPDFGPVTIKHLKFGAYRRIRAERQKIASAAQEKIAALPDLDPLPDADDTSDAAAAERTRLTPIYQARLLEAQELMSDSLAAIWKFILLGDESFQGLGTPKPPADVDEWPVELLIDASVLELAVAHMGKARLSPSGPSQNGAAKINEGLLAL